MRISRVHPQALVVADGDQRQSELRTLAELLGGYRKQLLDYGFSESESFTLVQHLIEQARWSTGTRGGPWSELKELWDLDGELANLDADQTPAADEDLEDDADLGDDEDLDDDEDLGDE